MKKSQGLPIHIIIVILIGIIVLAVVLLYVFGVIGESSNSTFKILNIGGNITKNAGNDIW